MPLPDSMAFSPPEIPVSATFSLRNDAPSKEYGNANDYKYTGISPKSVDIGRAWQGQMASGTVPMYQKITQDRYLKQVPVKGAIGAGPVTPQARNLKGVNQNGTNTPPGLI